MSTLTYHPLLQPETNVSHSTPFPCPNNDLSATERMVQDLTWLLSQPRGTVEWLSSRRDLVELCHSVWLAGSLPDAVGRPLTRRALVQRAFAITQLPMPASVESVVHRITYRRCDALSLVARYGAPTHLGLSQLVRCRRQPPRSLFET